MRSRGHFWTADDAWNFFLKNFVVYQMFLIDYKNVYEWSSINKQ